KSSKFYGVDPVHEVNEELYAKFGKFFPFAVGGKSKVSRASVLANGSYVDRDVIHIEFVYFLLLLGHKIYDDIWIDIEGAEYELFPYFYRGGELDRSGITVCQFNIEVGLKILA
uniref:Methyltransf_21 domain-containing protein n=1 Tax=Angiostrongylus cantonensis TaxID=6313 RepID=A0A0K0D7N2_ANGCA